MMRVILFSLLFSLLVLSPLCFAEEDENEVKHPAKNVFERKLVVDKANTKIILKEHKNYAAATDKKNFERETLAYVTPWYVVINYIFIIIYQ